eukprot:scpid68392/ scgid32768/ 
MDCCKFWKSSRRRSWSAERAPSKRKARPPRPPPVSTSEERIRGRARPSHQRHSLLMLPQRCRCSPPRLPAGGGGDLDAVDVHQLSSATSKLSISSGGGHRGGGVGLGGSSGAISSAAGGGVLSTSRSTSGSVSGGGHVQNGGVVRGTEHSLHHVHGNHLAVHSNTSSGSVSTQHYPAHRLSPSRWGVQESRSTEPLVANGERPSSITPAGDQSGQQGVSMPRAVVANGGQQSLNAMQQHRGAAAAAAA